MLRRTSYPDTVIVFQFFFFFQAEDGIRDVAVTGVQTCALPILRMLKLGDGSVRVMVQGLERARLAEGTPAEHWLGAGYQPPPNTLGGDARPEAPKRPGHAPLSRGVALAPHPGGELHRGPARSSD